MSVPYPAGRYRRAEVMEWSPPESVPKQRTRRLFQAGFFALFVLAPVLDIFRFDLTLGHFILFGQPWTLGLEPFMRGEIPPDEAALRLFLRGFVPLFGGAGLFLWIAWRFGRLYCGWLCPHFSVVETINGLLRRATGKVSLWDRKPLPPELPDGRRMEPDRRLWPVVIAAVLFFAFLWAVVLLTYLLPPAEVYGNLLRGEPTRNQTLFLTAGTLVLTVEFMFARHLFCRFACAVGAFQSIVWMANRKAMVVSFDRSRAEACKACNSACENACPMRLKPRAIKRRMFTCTQCTRCIDACTTFEERRGETTLLTWRHGQEALQESDR